MRLTIENNGLILLELSERGVTAPLMQSDRQAVFNCLIEAISIFSGVHNPIQSPPILSETYPATFDQSDRLTQHESDNVVHLKAVRASEI